MRIFYTRMDIEDLAASGAQELEIGPGVVLTDSARLLAEELGIALVTRGSAPAGAKSPTLAPAPAAKPEAGKSGNLPAKPRGCQHETPSPAAGLTGPGPSSVVEQLVTAVSALKKKGG